MGLFLTELVVRPYPTTAQHDGRNWWLEFQLIYRSNNLGQIVVPKDFIGDFASTPAFLWADIPPWGKWSAAAWLHDYVYWTQPCTREQADDLLMEAMQTCNVDARRRMLIYQGVRLGGQSSWDQDAIDRAAGKAHVSE